MVGVIVTLDNYFEGFIRESLFQYSEETQAYVSNVFSRSHKDLVAPLNRSIVLSYASARETGCFSSLQEIGDTVLFGAAFLSEGFSSDVVMSIGQLSYVSCWRMLRGKWTLYEELADNLPAITEHIAKAAK